jgi:nicotinamide-nucleotide amidase
VKERLGVEILTIGDELLRGELLDTNANWLASRVMELGGRVSRISSVGDAEAEIAQLVRDAARRSAFLITTGGLGPTDDDRTAEAVAQAAGVTCEPNESAIAQIRERFASRGLAYSPNNDRQGYLPSGAELLRNSRGTAPGFALFLAGCQLFSFPGVPSEMRWMFDTHLAPRLAEAFGDRFVQRRVFKLFGLGESHVDARLTDLLEGVPPECAVSLHYRATFPEVHVTLIGRGDDTGALSQVMDELSRRIDERVGKQIFARGDTSFGEAVVAALRCAGATVALAESCTGGLAGDLLTRASGASDVFQLGIVAYANHVKAQQLGVPVELIERDGAVSRSCAEAMARGIREQAGATYGIGITGIAGPSGGQRGEADWNGAYGARVGRRCASPRAPVPF